MVWTDGVCEYVGVNGIDFSLYVVHHLPIALTPRHHLVKMAGTLSLEKVSIAGCSHVESVDDLVAAVVSI